MNRQSPDLIDEQTVPLKQSDERRQGEVAEVFMIDRVEFAFFDEITDVREFKRSDPIVAEQRRDPLDEPIRFRHMGQNIIRNHNVRSAAFRDQFSRQFPREKVTSCWYAGGIRGSHWLRSGINSDDRNLVLHEVLQQVAVIARQLHHQVSPIQSASLHQMERVLPRMLQ